MWDESADGYARGVRDFQNLKKSVMLIYSCKQEGVASIVLKTLSQALQDCDSIECIIRETGVNQDGRTAGITMPSHKAQESLIHDTYMKAGLDLSEPHNRCQFFEAHG